MMMLFFFYVGLSCFSLFLGFGYLSVFHGMTQNHHSF